MLQGASSSPDNLDSFDPYGFVDINGEPYLTRNQILSPEAGGASRGERHQEDMGRINVDFDGTGNDLLSMSGVLIYCGNLVLNGEVDQDARQAQGDVGLRLPPSRGHLPVLA